MSAFPDWIVPMAATLTEQRFTGPEWLFERKFDGIRLLAFKQGREVRLYSRNRLPQTIPVVAEAIAALPPQELILDGEMTWDRQTAFHVFDVPWCDRSIMSLPLDERRALLDTLPLHPPLHRVAELTGHAPWDQACAKGWEGVIAKRRDSVYEQRRSKAWLKMKCELTHDFIVGGFTDPQGARVGLGALLVGHHQNGAFAFAGKVGTGFDTKMLVDLRRRLDAIEIPAPPFTASKGLPRLRAHWVRPEIAVKVAFIEWTAHGKLRHPRLIEVVS
jgi:ATP-dependent DNA ligase